MILFNNLVMANTLFRFIFINTVFDNIYCTDFSISMTRYAKKNIVFPQRIPNSILFLFILR